MSNSPVHTFTASCPRFQRTNIRPTTSCILVMFLSLSPNFASAAPGFHVEATDLDLGRLDIYDSESETWVPETKVKREIPIHNRGELPLRLSRISADCGCVSARIADLDIVPGGHSSIEITVDLSRAHLGHNRVNIYLRFGDPEYELVTLPITFNFLPEILVTPSSITYYSTPTPERKNGDKFRVDITISYLKEIGPDLVVGVETSNASIEASIYRAPPTQTPSRYFRVGVTVLGISDLPVGPIDEWVTIRLAPPRARQIRIPITGRIESPYRVNPPLIIVSTGPSTAISDIERRIKISANGSRITLNGASCPHENISVEILDNRSELVTLRVTVKIASTSDENSVHIDTSVIVDILEPVAEHLEIPVYLQGTR